MRRSDLYNVLMGLHTSTCYKIEFLKFPVAKKDHLETASVFFEKSIYFLVINKL